MSYAAAPWPPSLVGTPAVAVIEQAIERSRLSHSLLLHGDDLGTLVGVGHAIADRLLNPPKAAARFNVKDHPDYLSLRPKGKSRIIPIGRPPSPEPGTMRDFLPKLYVTPSVAPRKVAILYEADRMEAPSANAFLKTLEEPPANTTLLLLTTRPYALLPTILSRVLHFRFPSTVVAVQTDGWAPWLDDYRAWLGRLADGTPTDKRVIADHVFSAYGLVARFSAVLDFATDAVWKEQKEKLPDDLDDAEEEAIQTGIANGIRLRLFAEIAYATRAFALPRLKSGDAVTRRALTTAIEHLEHDTGLLRLNLNEAAALESFLLTSLRVWTKR
ncbi:MAG: DNA polymerase III subunit gamma/tau [Verrucomicrobia bacterium]|nr:DNA polymerase III subunit gamma/tau [Verrucomicrobiota bacterium]